MVAQQEATLGLTMKGKRTKRSRPVSPISMVVDEGETSSIESGRLGSGNITEEEDMAHCLILLAQGLKPKSNNARNDDNNKVVGLPYECKTCNKSFPSFQALGGHRASHKKPKLETFESGVVGFKPDQLGKKSSPFFSILDNGGDFDHHDRDNNPFNEGISLSLQIANGTTSNSNRNSNNNKLTKMHECGICGAEFSSGQALGGHMRRHRPIGGSLKSVTSSSTINMSNVNDNNSNNRDKDQEKNQTRNFLSLDLNLPAPEDDRQHQHHQQGGSNFVFTSKEKTLVFTSTSLVNCHY